MISISKKLSNLTQMRLYVVLALSVLMLAMLSNLLNSTSVSPLKFPGVKSDFAYSETQPLTASQVKALADIQPQNFKTTSNLQLRNVSLPILRSSSSAQAVSPNAIKQMYNLYGDNGGSGTIAIIDADQDTSAEADLGTFSTMYNLPSCTIANGCFTQYIDNCGGCGTVETTTADATSGAENQGETSLDIEWAHAIAPNAKILLVEVPTLQYFPEAVQYAAAQTGVVAVSMSFGGQEQSSETTIDSVFASNNGGNVAFFAATGDCGYEPCGTSSAGVTYPSSSPNVIAVGGTTVGLNYDGTVRSEKGWGYQVNGSWTGSNGGVSAYETEPSYQSTYGVPQANGFRTTPDVSLNADPATGYPIYTSTTFAGHPEDTGWLIFGGTSASTPIWAAIDANVQDLSPAKLYQDATNSPSDLRNISTGTNGPCGYYCTARAGYNYVTGLGVPNTYKF